ncbi:bacteriohemerythrin [Alkaliphilus serpentinus]|uniref:Bacteriohemerythrin n=1 Tax=Alkaliphilus serpentinus TaxID=1482731 RepID=A0A833HR46_9FIRM|nr:bacteriohemerythrin [Alkaliphilus serpentinus]KAB3532731.1 bacteriohemerythrin [Alkaliphilus serpentinus]
MLKWEGSFETGIEKVDHQHKYLVELINRLEEEILHQLKYDNYDKIVEVLMDLRNYTMNHFNSEELLMKEALSKFQDETQLANFWTYFKKHKKEHSAFVEKVELLTNSDIDQEQEEISINLVQFLVDWLKNHILTIDLQLPRYLNSNEVS